MLLQPEMIIAAKVETTPKKAGCGGSGCADEQVYSKQQENRTGRVKYTENQARGTGQGTCNRTITGFTHEQEAYTAAAYKMRMSTRCS
jgi:hypothetical protein